MNELFQDLRFGLRTLRKSPGFTLVALATLAIGIGANTAIFSFVDGVMLKPLPYAEPDRIMRVVEKSPQGDPNGISTLTYLDWAKQNTVFAAIAAQRFDPVTYTGGAQPVQLRAGRVSASYFDVFGVKAALGRTFAPGEDQPGRDGVAVLNHAIWVTLFGADPAIIGRSILLDGVSRTVVGVLPAGGAFDRKYAQVWYPMAFTPAEMTRDFHWFVAFARLKPGVTLQQARSQMDVIGARLAVDHPLSNKNWGVKVDPLAETVVGKQLTQSLYVLLAAVGMVLLIACANLANLTLARGVAREREVAIRAALGAGRWRLIRQFLTESVLLAVGGGILGLAVGHALVAGIWILMPPDYLPGAAEIAIDGRVMFFALGLSALTGIVFGLVPAVHATRADLMNPLKQGGLGSSPGRARRGLRSGLVITEVALAFILLSGAGLLIRSFMLLQKSDLGFQSANVITAQLTLSNRRFPAAVPFQLYLHRIQDELSALPGVRDVAVSSILPMQGWGYGMPFQVVGEPVVDLARRSYCFFKIVSPSYFQVLGLRLTKGRLLDEGDIKGAPPAIVINATMARKYFPNADPVGRRILVQEIGFAQPQLGADIPWEVVGVVADEAVEQPGDKRDNPGVYATYGQSPVLYASLIVRGAMEPSSLQQTLEKTIHGIDRDQALSEVKTLDQLKAESLGGDRLQAALLASFAAVALLLSAIGLYGVISYTVEQRTREIGIRSALGASPADILRLILRSGMTLTGIGLAFGLAGAFALTRLLSSLLFGVGEHDPSTLAIVALALASTGALACYIPARRATRVNPIIALRYE